MADIVEVDCRTKRVTTRPMTPDEEQQYDQDQRDAAERQAVEKEKQRVRLADIARLKERAKTDPDFAALLRVQDIS